MYPLVLELAAPDALLRVPVSVTCRVLGFSKQAFYQWCRRRVSDREFDEAYLLNAIFDIHRDDTGFGYRLIWDELRRRGFQVSLRRVWRICSENHVWAHFTKSKAKYSSPGPAVHDDLVRRRFVADRRDQLWLTDITEHATGEGKLYLCAVMDVFSGMIVGYSIADHRRESLAVNALDAAVSYRGRHGTIVHSDRGSQFTSTTFLSALKANKLQGSMGRVAACADNAAMESFFALLQKNVLDLKYWTSRQELRLAIVVWIERTYHRRRGKTRLGGLTPVEYEKLHAA